MDVVREVSEVRERVAAARRRGCRIGCVPTMGALHAGHVSLIEECLRHVDFTVLTIFVNPTQFAPNEDLSQYPRPIQSDLAACRDAGVDCVYLPEIQTLYPQSFETWITVEKMSSMLEGEFRPTHFRGVTTIVAKLFNIVQPDIACFGAKDYQQQAMIRRMVLDLNLPIEIVVCPTIREPDGLALSSRNIYLTKEQRKSALVISRTLNGVRERLQAGETDITELEKWMTSQLDACPNVHSQYAVLRDPGTLAPLKSPQPEVVALIAAQVGQTRLIDNLTIELQISHDSLAG